MLPLKRSWTQLSAQLAFSQRKYALQAAVILLLIVSIVVGSTGVGLAAQNALPGEPLYPVKLALEQVELLTTFDLAKEIRLHVAFAQNRLSEVGQLLLEGNYALIPGTLARFESHITQAVQKLEVLAIQDADKARDVASMVHSVLIDQAIVLRGISSLVPQNLEPQLASALSVAASSATVVADVVVRSGGSLNQDSSPASESTPSLVETEESIAPFEIQETYTPTPSATAYWSPTPSTSLTATASPTYTATPSLEPSSTPTIRPTSTPKPPSDDGGNPDRPSATDTPKPPPTSTPKPPDPDPTDDDPEPTKTKKPLPDPTRRPPKPTKETSSK